MIPGLLVREGEKKGVYIKIPEKKAFAIGRHPEIDFTIESDPMISGIHCHFIRKQNVLYMKDRSRNGTRLNSRKIHNDWAVLKLADILRIGRTHLEVTDLDEEQEKSESVDMEACIEDLEKREDFEEDPLYHRQIGNYHPIEALGEGAFGFVYKALDLQARKLVALKMMHTSEEGGVSERMIGRFFREAELLKKLEHPFLIKLHEASYMELDGEKHHYIAMEYFSGVNLFSHVKSYGYMPWKKVLKVLGQLASALDHMHKNGIIHRDLKPENILYNPIKGVAKIIDLGFGKSVVDEERQTFFITQTGSSLGTPYYMPIEQWEEAKSVTETADIYSLGATAYFMLSGKIPFERYQDYLELFRAVSQKRLIPLQEYCKEEVPKELIEIVEKMMAFESKNRYPTSRKLLKALKKFAQKYKKT